MGARLILVKGEGPSAYELSAFNTLGRHPENTIQVLDRIVSKEHCRITRGPHGGWILRDIASLNGSYVNGERVAEHSLKSGDEISLGNTVLRFVEDEEQAQPLQNITVISDGLQTHLRSSMDAQQRFVPAAEMTNVDALRVDYEKLRIAHELSQK